MNNDKSKNIIIALLIVIIIILGALVALFATNTISLNTNTKEENTNIDDNSNNINSTDTDINNDEQKVSRDDIIIKLKDSLTNQDWVKENLYSEENCFGSEIDTTTQNLKFIVLSNSEDNPIVIVLNYTDEKFINTTYKVYYKDGKILAQNITGYVEHPSHVGFSVDKNQGLVISTYMHMGNYIFKAYDVKNDEIKIYDEYQCVTGDCYEYKGDKTYDISDISIELTDENINSYIK